jgi:rhodanese-related sulfurtransferase
MHREAPQLAPADARVLLGRGASAVDVREQQEWDAGRMPDSIWIPLDELAGRLDELPAGPLLIVCRTGARSGYAADALTAMGRDAANLAGGLWAWAQAGLPLDPADGRVL